MKKCPMEWNLEWKSQEYSTLLNKCDSVQSGTYYFKTKLRKIYNSFYPVCDRCKTEEGSLSHMVWFCPKLFHFWSAIVNFWNVFSWSCNSRITDTLPNSTKRPLLMCLTLVEKNNTFKLEMFGLSMFQSLVGWIVSCHTTGENPFLGVQISFPIPNCMAALHEFPKVWIVYYYCSHCNCPPPPCFVLLGLLWLLWLYCLVFFVFLGW